MYALRTSISPSITHVIYFTYVAEGKIDGEGAKDLCYEERKRLHDLNRRAYNLHGYENSCVRQLL